jgi:hypothetical protein
VALGILGVAVGAFLFGALRERGSGPITGDARAVVATPAPAVDASLIAAQKRVKLHPASVEAYLDLGNAYLNLNRTAAADQAFVRAMRLAPARPEAKTMHALITAGSSTRPLASLTLLWQVEAAHPGYSHAWLADGLLSSRDRSSFGRAIADFHRFLTLAPRATVDSQVRALLTGLKRAIRQPKSSSAP